MRKVRKGFLVIVSIFLVGLLVGCSGNPIENVKDETKIVNVAEDFASALENKNEDLLKSIIVSQPAEEYQDIPRYFKVGCYRGKNYKKIYFMINFGNNYILKGFPCSL